METTQIETKVAQQIPTEPVMIWSVLATKNVGTLLAAYGFGRIAPARWSEIALVWGYSPAATPFFARKGAWLMVRTDHQ
jgi:hypothetical protein